MAERCCSVWRGRLSVTDFKAKKQLTCGEPSSLSNSVISTCSCVDRRHDQYVFERIARDPMFHRLEEMRFPSTNDGCSRQHEGERRVSVLVDCGRYSSTSALSSSFERSPAIACTLYGECDALLRCRSLDDTV